MTESAKIAPGAVTGVDVQALFDGLAHVCEQLQDHGATLTLEQSMILYEEGVRLEKLIRAELSSAERRMVMILEADGTEVPFDHSPSTITRGLQDLPEERK